MPYDLTKLTADVCQVQHPRAHFGSGRLIGENLVLTAAHVALAYGIAGTAAERPIIEEGWQVRFESDRDGTSWPFRHDGKLVWIDRGLDLALIAIKAPDLPLTPRLALRIADIRTNEPHEVEARGYPQASKEETGKRALTPLAGKLRKVTEGQALRLSVERSDLPNRPHADWPGMSGSAVYRAEAQSPGRIWIYGVSKEVPANFDGILRVGPLAGAWSCATFRSLLDEAGVSLADPRDPQH